MTVFDQPVKLTLSYNVNDLPEGVTSVGMAFYNTTDGWVYLDAEANSLAELGNLTAPVNHFTVFAVLATVEETTEPEPTTEPEHPEPASFSLNNLTISLSESRVFAKIAYIIRTGEEAIITVDVTNNGGQAGSYRAALLLNGNEQQSQTITLGVDETKTVSFTAAGNDPGHYTVTIGDMNGEFESELWVNWWLIGGSIAMGILLVCLIWYLIQRRKAQD
jgi:hypothetical protein